MLYTVVRQFGKQMKYGQASPIENFIVEVKILPLAGGNIFYFVVK